MLAMLRRWRARPVSLMYKNLPSRHQFDVEVLQDQVF
jgi:hypothetical protein